MIKLKIAHISDTHGSPAIVRSVAGANADIIILTGDILQNHGRRPMAVNYAGWDAFSSGWQSISFVI